MILLYKIFNRIISNFAKRITTRCVECGESVLEKVIRSVNGEKSKRCKRCFFLFYYTRGLERLLRSLKITLDQSNLEPTVKTGYDLSTVIKGAHAIYEGVAKFGYIHPYTASIPLSVILEFTRLCNLKCPHCYMNTYHLKSKINLGYELTSDEWLNCVNRLSEAGVVSVTFSGGEAILRDDFFKVAEYASHKGLNTALATNGTLLNAEVAKKLHKIGITYVAISLYSAKKDLNDAIRGQGSFECSINAAKYCLKEGITVELALTLLQSVKDEIDEFLSLAKNVGVDVAAFLNFIPLGNADKSLDLTPSEREEALRAINKKRQEYDRFFKKIVVLQATHIARVSYDMAEDKEKFELQQIGFTKFLKPGRSKYLKQVGGCAAGRFMAAITSGGDILPCPFLRISVGNIVKDNFSDVWINNKILNKLRDRRNWKGNCGKCDYNIVCGGCRARAYTYLIDFLESDPGCLLNS